MWVQMPEIQWGCSYFTASIFLKNRKERILKKKKKKREREKAGRRERMRKTTGEKCPCYCNHLIPFGTYMAKFGILCDVLLLQLCQTPCDPMKSSLPDSSVHSILQARILDWFVVSSSRESSRSRDWTHISYSCLLHWQAGRFFTNSATREAQTQHISG